MTLRVRHSAAVVAAGALVAAALTYSGAAEAAPAARAQRVDEPTIVWKRESLNRHSDTPMPSASAWADTDVDSDRDGINDVVGDGLLDRWPLFYDNYFVPRGYAVALVDMTGTAGSTGCPTIQGANENVSGPMVIDWLNGRRSARDADGSAVTVDWHNGESAMIGKSYDGALAMAGAVSGVEGPVHGRPHRRPVQLLRLHAQQRHRHARQ